jgi:hypothetical protein
MSFMDFLIFTSHSLHAPTVLFFLLGLIASKIKANVRLPRSVTQALGFYLVIAIGFRGGVELVRHPLDWQALAVLLLSIFFSFNLPFLVYACVRLFLRHLRPVDAIAISAHYGSVSLVTFIAATAFLNANSVDFESYLLVCIVLMETPAILAALLMKFFWLKDGDQSQFPVAAHLREIFFPGGSVLLVGAFLVGVISGNEGSLYTYGFFNVPFQGILCFFLLDMGLVAGLQLERAKDISSKIFAFGILMPLLCGTIGLIAAKFLGLSSGGSALFAILCSSASYIVVPSAIRLGMPEANHSVAITLALGITFPFNIIFGVPVFYWLSLHLV